jgi:hypothetical protein
MTLLPTGKVLVAGGFNAGATDTAEFYDPDTGQWTTTGPMVDARYDHTATLLPMGKVLVVGGVDNGFLASAELYDPTTGQWHATAALPPSELTIPRPFSLPARSSSLGVAPRMG